MSEREKGRKNERKKETEEEIMSTRKRQRKKKTEKDRVTDIKIVTEQVEREKERERCVKYIDKKEKERGKELD